MGGIRKVYYHNKEYYDIFDKVDIKLIDGTLILGSISEILNSKMHLYLGGVKGLDIKYKDIKIMVKGSFEVSDYGVYKIS